MLSADSRQVYKGLNVGTGKITKKEMQGVKHHLLDVASPKKQFSADDFVKLAHSHILKNVGISIVVGGTGFYIDALTGRLNFPNVPPHKTLRKHLSKKTAKQLFAQLKKLDPRRAKTIEPENPRRLIRAIEIAKALGKNPLPRAEKKYDVLWLGLNPKDLKKKIHTRLKAREGMISEAKRLHAHGLSYKRMQELGLEYKYLALLLQKKLNREQFFIELERAINRYAKRQMRYFKRNKDIIWVSSQAEALRISKRALRESNPH